MRKSDFGKQLARLLDDDLSEQESRALLDAIHESPELRRLAAKAICIDRILRESNATSSVDTVMDALPDSVGRDIASPVMESIEAIEQTRNVKRIRRSLVRGQRRRPSPVLPPRSRLRFVPYAAAAALLCTATVLLMRSLGKQSRTIATIVAVRGDATGQSCPLRVGQELSPPCILSVNEGELGLRYPDGTTIAVAANSTISLKDTDMSNSLELELARGGLMADVAPQPGEAPLTIRTKHALITVLGTKFWLSSGSESSHLLMDHGKVLMVRHRDGRTATVIGGQQIDSADMQITSATPSHPSKATRTAINFGGDTVLHDGMRWLSEDEATSGGLRVQAGKLRYSSTELFTDAPASLQKVLNTNIWSHRTDLNVEYPLANGEYEVFLYVAENYKSRKRIFNVHLEGRLVATSVGNLDLGQWKRYGPYSSSIKDRHLSLRLEQKVDSPHLMGIVIRSAPHKR